MNILSTFRQGLRRPEEAPLFGLAFQGTAAECWMLHAAGLVLKDEPVRLTDGTIGRKLTEEGRAVGSRMRS